MFHDDNFFLGEHKRTFVLNNVQQRSNLFGCGIALQKYDTCLLKLLVQFTKFSKQERAVVFRVTVAAKDNFHVFVLGGDQHMACKTFILQLMANVF